MGEAHGGAPVRVQVVGTIQGLGALCRRLAEGPYLALDTEFVREQTYYPRLCLIQAANDQGLACIDTLAVRDLDPLREVLCNPAITKVLHGCRQDLEVLYQSLGLVPRPIFDTQIAAELLGHGDQVGYASLVQRELGVGLDKSHTRADWSLRPLPQDWLEYAADDVRHLCALYERLRARLERRGRLAWLAEDFDRLADPELYRPQPERAWQRIKGCRSLRDRQFAVLMALAAWRERVAMEADRPRQWVMTDPVLIRLARRQPADLDEIERGRGVSDLAIRRHGRELLRLIAEARDRPPARPPESRPRPAAGPAEEALADAAMAVLRLRAAAEGLAPEALASRKDLLRLSAGDEDLPLLRGWRWAVAGSDIRRLIAGEARLGVEAGVPVLRDA